MKILILIMPFLFTINSNAKILHTLGGAAVGYAVGKAGSNSNSTQTITKYNSTTFRCFCIGKINFSYNAVYCDNERNGDPYKREDILFFQTNNAPNIIVEPLKTKKYNTSGCEIVNN